MQNVKCPSCGNTIIDISKSCPNCEFQLTLEILSDIVSKEQRSKKHLLIGVIVVVAIIFISALLFVTKTETPRIVNEARRAQIEKLFSSVDGSHSGLTALIKKFMLNPNSYKHISTTYTDEGKFLIANTKYQGKGVSGNYIVYHASAKVDLSGNVLVILSQWHE